MSVNVKDPVETITFPFDFSGLTDTTPSAAVCSATPYQGADSTPIVEVSQNISGSIVDWNISGGTDGMIYKMRCVGTVAGEPLVVAGLLVVLSLP